MGWGDGRKRERREVGEGEGARKGEKGGRMERKRSQRGARGRKPFLQVSSTAF